MAGILEVRPRTWGKEHVHTFAMEAGDFGGEVFVRLNFSNRFEIRFQGLRSLGLDGSLVHAGAVVVANFLLNRSALRTGCGRLLQNVLENIFAALAEFIEASPTRSIRGDRILFLPASACVGVEVVAWLNGWIQHVRVEAHALFSGYTGFGWSNHTCRSRCLSETWCRSEKQKTQDSNSTHSS